MYVEKVMMIMIKLKMVCGEGEFDDDYDVLLRTLQTQKTLLFWFCSKQDSKKQARKPRSYASSKLWPTHSLADGGEV